MSLPPRHVDALQELASRTELLPGFEQSFLIDTSAYLGIRETRRIQGRTMLSYADIAEGERFADSVAVMTSDFSSTAR